MQKIILVLLLGVFFLSCGKEYPCENVTCRNGGICANGVCNCPVGFTGSDCSLQQKPARINIRSATITKFPVTRPNGNSWDFSDGPDIYLMLLLNNVEIANNRLQTIANTISTPVTFTNLPLGFEMSDATNQYVLRVMDRDDFGPDEELGSIFFTPYQSTNGFPELLFVDCSVCNVAFVLTVTYEF